MEIQKYKNMIEKMMYADDMTYGFVSGSRYQFFIRAAQYRLTWDRRTNTIVMPNLNTETNDVEHNSIPAHMITPAEMIAKLKGLNTEVTYYIPTSESDAFQASTSLDVETLPYELVHHLELLLSTAREDIRRYSVEARIH